MRKVVVDVGGSAIKYALMESDATIVEKGEVPTPLDARENFIQTLVDLCTKYEGDIDGLAISMPGNIDSDTGHIYTPGALTFNKDTNIIESLKEKLSINIAVENDGKSAALAEKWLGNLSDCHDGVVMVIGTGIGGGIIVNDRLLKGEHFFAGELSYVMDGNPLDFTSCFAMTGATTSLVRNYGQFAGVDHHGLDGRYVFDLINQGDEMALKALESMTMSIAKQIFNLQAILDTQRFVIGGGVSRQPLLLVKIQENLDKIYENLPSFCLVPHADVKACKFYNDANLIGALYNYILRFESNN